MSINVTKIGSYEENNFTEERYQSKGVACNGDSAEIILEEYGNEVSLTVISNIPEMNILSKASVVLDEDNVADIIDWLLLFRDRKQLP